jgi:hypothetical protein
LPLDTSRRSRRAAARSRAPIRRSGTSSRAGWRGAQPLPLREYTESSASPSLRTTRSSDALRRRGGRHAGAGEAARGVAPRRGAAARWPECQRLRGIAFRQVVSARPFSRRRCALRPGTRRHACRPG